jgi:hypothetical protein
VSFSPPQNPRLIKTKEEEEWGGGGGGMKGSTFIITERNRKFTDLKITKLCPLSL